MAECQAQAEDREGYLDWHAKSRRWERQGHKQKQCRECGLWIWPDEESRCPDFSVIAPIPPAQKEPSE